MYPLPSPAQALFMSPGLANGFSGFRVSHGLSPREDDPVLVKNSAGPLPFAVPFSLQ